MEKCKSAVSVAAVILALVLVIAVVPTDRDAAVYNDTIRLHILANSDKTEDQTLKLSIRDKLITKYSDVLKDAQSKHCTYFLTDPSPPPRPTHRRTMLVL